MIEPMIDPLGQLRGKWSGVFELFCNSIKMLSMHKLESFDRLGATQLTVLVLGF